MIIVPSGSNPTIDIQVLDDNGLAVTGLVAATFPAISYSIAGPNTTVAVTLTDLGSLTAAYSSGGVKERSGGYYRFDLPAAAVSTAGTNVTVFGEATGKHVFNYIAVSPAIGVAASVTGSVGSVVGSVGSVAGSVGSISGVTFPANFSLLSVDGSGRVLLQPTQAGVTIPTVTSVTNQLTAAQVATGVWQDATTGDFTVASSIGKSLYTSGNAPGSTSGLALVGSNVGTATSVTGSVGSVVGSVGSVVGSVGSISGVTFPVNFNLLSIDGSGRVLLQPTQTGVTIPNVTNVTTVTGNVNGNVAGSTGSVTGNVNGNVVGSAGSVIGSVGSVAGSVGAVAGNVTGDVQGKVLGGGSGTITGDGVRASSVSGAVGSVTGAVGSVTGAVGSVAGNVSGDVGGKVLGSGSSIIAGAGCRADSVTGSVGSVVGSVGSVAGAVGSISGVTFPSNFGSFSIDSLGRLLLQPAQPSVVIPTVTNLTNSAVNGDLTAAMKASVTTAATAATPVAASVTGSVGSVVGSVGSVVGSVGSISGVTFPSNFGLLVVSPSGIVSANSTQLGGTSATGMLSATGVGSPGFFANIPAASGPTLNQIVQGVWQDTTAGDFTVPNSAGAYLKSAGGGTIVVQNNILINQAQAQAAMIPYLLPIVIGDTLGYDWNLGTLTGWSKIVLTAKKNITDADSAAVFQVEALSAGGGGLLVLNGQSASNPTQGSITVGDATVGLITLVIAAAATNLLPQMNGLGSYSIRVIYGTSPVTTRTPVINQSFSVTRTANTIVA